MSFRQIVRVDLNPEYAAEAAEARGDVKGAIVEAIPWIITQVVAARDFGVLREGIEELGARDGHFRALVACEILGRAGARPDVRSWVCEYLSDRDLSRGARYQLANAHAQLGAEARRAGDGRRAVALARRGLEAVADLPPRAVTATLYYNLGVALQDSGEVDAALEAFEDSAEVDEIVGRSDEADMTREHARRLRASMS